MAIEYFIIPLLLLPLFSRLAEPSTLVFFTYNGRKVALARPVTHNDAVNWAKKTFPGLSNIPPERISISAHLPDHPGQGAVEIDPEAWKLGTKGVEDFIVRIIEDETYPDNADGEEVGACMQAPGTSWSYARRPTPQTWTLRPAGQGLYTDGQAISELRIGKPVIYLYPPSPINVKVKLSLASHSKFSAVYPQPVKGTFKEGSSSQTAEWDVVARPDGMMTMVGTSMEVAYIFWEAEANPSNGLPDSPPMSRSPSPVQTSQPGMLRARAGFVPGTTRCSPHDSVVMSVNEVPPYLEKALLVLGLHTEARTSFITYWLPDFLKHKHLALRFVPQVDFEASAPLDINPKPDVVTRVFMLFEGILTERLGDWDEARERSSEDVNLWKGVVGVDETRQTDASLFRVLEWGGMEVR